MSYGIYVGKNHTSDGHAWLAGYGDEPSSHWLEIIPQAKHSADKTITVGVSDTADLPGLRTVIPQVPATARHIRVSYSYYKGVPAPLTNGGLNEHGVAVRDIWSTSRDELIAMTPPNQTGPNYSDLARIVIERATTAREGVELIANLIAEHGESTYGGNSHIIADADEAWVIIQFAGGQGLWAAERLGPDSIRASRPGYIGIIPIDDPSHPDFLYSPNLIEFAKSQGWYNHGSFDVNTILGDGKGRWEGVRWVEDKMTERAKRPEKIGLHDMIWAIRTPVLTGDRAGYGQVVPLLDPSHDVLRMLWHAPIGAIAAPFAPVFMGQDTFPEEFQMHRYLSAGEDHRFMDRREGRAENAAIYSAADQRVEGLRSAVFECKRLLYLMLQDKDRYTDDVVDAFETREASLSLQTDQMLKAAERLIEHGDETTAVFVLEYFSGKELIAGLDLVIALSASIEARVKLAGRQEHHTGFRKYDQLW